MKKLYFLFFLVFGLSASAQIVNIPDANFKTKLLESSPFSGIAKDLSGQYFKIDQNNDGNIQESEALQVSYLHISYSNISNLTGIASFTNLNYLNCSANYITSLNVNGLTGLSEFDCSGNQITSLNLSQLVNLTIFNCSGNQITNLNLSSLTNLVEVFCAGNLLSNLSLSNCINLQRLDCYDNSLTDINLTGINNLIRLNIYNNQLNSLNLPAGFLTQRRIKFAITHHNYHAPERPNPSAYLIY